MNAKDIEAMDKWLLKQRLQAINENTPDKEAIELIRGCNKYSIDLPANLMPYVIKCCDAWEQTNSKSETPGLINGSIQQYGM